MNTEKKICVYAICKNEEKFVNRFMDSIEKEIDSKDVYILDTGSTDNTVSLFKQRGVNIEVKNYEKFYFDVARNDSLALVPEDYDICICLDLDDVIQPNFVEQIRKLWKDDTCQLRYDYLYSVDENDNPLVVFKNNHIHSRKGWYWKSPIHEFLRYNGDNFQSVTSEELKIIHHPDKTKSRAFYLDLLEEQVATHPDDTRNIYLLTREYVNKRMFLKCIETGHKYFNNKVSYAPEMCKVMSYLAKSYRGLEWYEESIFWANKAITIYPNLRDGYVEKIATEFYYKKYNDLIETAKKALEIKEPDKEIYSDIAGWDGSIYDYLSLAYYRLGRFEEAIETIDIDIRQNPNIQRLKENRELFVKALNKKEELLGN